MRGGRTYAQEQPKTGSASSALTSSPRRGLQRGRTAPAPSRGVGGYPDLDAPRGTIAPWIASRPTPDALEKEADRVADHVLRTPEPVPVAHAVARSTTAGDAVQCKRIDEAALGGGTGGSSSPGGAAPAFMPAVLGSPGRPLGPSERRFFEPRFERDFGDVRVHDDPEAARSAQSAGALAYTVGRDIVFGPGQYRPGSADGKKLLAHELAHVVQQRGHGATATRSAGEPSLEGEANRASLSTVEGRRSDIRHAAPAAPQFFRVKAGGHEFEVGDVTLDAAAKADVLTHGNLLSPADQVHLIVHGNQLGYDVAYTTPEDPFRWNALTRIIGNQHLDIKGIGGTDSFDVLEDLQGVATVRKQTLLALMAGGITLTTLSRAKALAPNKKFYIASTDAARDKIFYDTSKSGRGMLGSNSLAHELFGHFALDSAGTPGGHSVTAIPQSAGILDPFGQPFVGSVNDFISGFAGASGLKGPLDSPTFNVGTSFLTAALSDLKTTGAQGLSGNSRAGWKTTSALDRTWMLLSQNYRALTNARLPASTAPGAKSAVPTPAQVESDVLTWYKSLSVDQRWVFAQYIANLTAALLSGKPAELAQAIEPRL
jgi:hypothetical protein